MRGRSNSANPLTKYRTQEVHTIELIVSDGVVYDTVTRMEQTRIDRPRDGYGNRTGNLFQNVLIPFAEGANLGQDVAPVAQALVDKLGAFVNLVDKIAAVSSNA
jgi:hypothetical protein